MKNNSSDENAPIHEGVPHGPYLSNPDMEQSVPSDLWLFNAAHKDPALYQLLLIREGVIQARADKSSPIDEEVFTVNYHRINQAIIDSEEAYLDERIKRKYQADVYRPI